MNRINKVRIKKKLYLLFKLVGVNGGKPANAYYNLEEESTIRWCFIKEIQDKMVINIEYKIWKEFLQWLRHRDIITSMDFEEKAHWM